MNYSKNGGHYILITGERKKDFLVYNLDDYQMTNEKITDNDIMKVSMNSEILQKLKSSAWSCSCNWLFVLQNNGIFLINVWDDIVWFCKKHSFNFIEKFLNGLTKCS